MISRRRFGQLAAGVSASSLALLQIPAAIGTARPRVVIIGGGVAGSLLARRLARAGGFSITLIEKERTYTSCFFGSHVLAGYRSVESLTFSYQGLSRLPNLDLLHASVISVDTERKRVRLSDGGELPYDRVVFATGIGFRTGDIEGYDDQAALRMPHAYADGADVQRLRLQLESMPDGGLVVISAPQSPYRCPPAPYERATLIANYLKKQKPASRVLIIDAKNSFPLQALFEQAWHRFYPDMIEWLPADMAGELTGVDPRRMVVKTDFEDFQGDVVSIIPPQRAGRLLLRAELADETGWCPVDFETLASTRVSNAYVIGDATALAGLPKTATAAKSQAEHCAAAIRAEFGERRSEDLELNNACYMLLADRHAIRLEASYRANGESIEKKTIKVSEEQESDAVRKQTAVAGAEWFTSLTGQMFG